MTKDGPYGVSGIVGSHVEDRKLEENSCCGVSKGHFGITIEHGGDDCGEVVNRTFGCGVSSGHFWRPNGTWRG